MATDVLLVDEDRDILEVSKAFLGREAGLSVSTETDAPAALDRVTAGGVDVVVTDLTMPELGGMELAREISDHRPGVPVFVFTGSDPATIEDDGDVVAGFVQKGAGTDQYSDLADRIRAAVE